MVIYTAILGGVDRLPMPIIKAPCRMVCFSDQRWRHQGHWEVVDWRQRISDGIPGNAALLSRYFKILPHRHFEDDYTIWIDGSDILRGNPLKLIPFNEDMLLFRHPERTCVYSELDAIRRFRKDTPETTERLKSHYLDVGVPKNVGLAACSMIWRRRTGACIDFCERWWQEILDTQTVRDQPAWAVTQWRKPISVRLLPGNHMRNEYVRRRSHARPGHHLHATA